MGTRDIGARRWDGRWRRNWLLGRAYDAWVYLPWPLILGAILIALLVGYRLQTVQKRGLGVGSVSSVGSAPRHYSCEKGGYAIDIPAGWLIGQVCDAQFGLRVESADHMATFEIAMYPKSLSSMNEVRRLLIEATQNEGATTPPTVSAEPMGGSNFFRTVSSIATNGVREAYEMRVGFHADSMYIFTLRVLSARGGHHAAFQNNEILHAYATVHFQATVKGP